MDRNIVQVARIRAVDARMGDIVNRESESTRGWFPVEQIDELHDGKINLSDGGVNNSFTVNPLDIIGLQIVKEMQIADQPSLPDIVLRFLGGTGDAPVDPGDVASENDGSAQPVAAH